MTNTPTVRAAFVEGMTYSTRSACDYDTIYSFTIVKRTAKTVTLTSWRGQHRRKIIRGDDGVERCLPRGRYSMAPMISADSPDEEAA